MSKLISFKVPTEKGIREAEGFVAWLELEPGKKHKFVLQLDIDRPTILADYRTGYKVGSFAGLMLARYVSNPYAYHGKYRAYAQAFLGSIIARAGIEKVESELAKFPTLNGADK